MALRVLMLKKRIDDKRTALDELKKVDFATREAELETAIEEANSDEERSVVDEAIETFEAEKRENAEKIRELEGEISDLEKELREIEENNEEPEAEEIQPEPVKEERRVVMPEMTKRVGLYALSMEERNAVMSDESVVNFLARARECIKEKRALTNVGLTIPQVMLPMLRQIVEANSKLAGRVNLQHIGGTGRMNIMGSIPEGVWTEMCGTINEGAISFTNIELDGFKVGCFIPVCNALLEDSDIALASEIISMLGQGLGYALDKAIVFGTGTKMPTGMAVATGLVKTSLSGKSGKALFAAMLKGCGSMKHELGELVWIMNRTTHLAIMAETVEFNSAAALVASANSTMPVVGGAIVELDFVKDNEIIVGYGQRYKLARRADIRIAQSTEAKFIEDQTVFKATARYDGKPVFADAFMAFGLTGAPTAALDTNHPFAADTANTPAQSAGGKG